MWSISANRPFPSQPRHCSHCFETEAYKDTKIKHTQTNMPPTKRRTNKPNCELEQTKLLRDSELIIFLRMQIKQTLKILHNLRDNIQVRLTDSFLCIFANTFVYIVFNTHSVNDRREGHIQWGGGRR